jgi:hypothetical protein
MLSPGMTSLGIISVGRGWIPFHGPTIWKSTGSRQGRVGSSKTLPEKHITNKTEYTNTQQGLPVHGIHSHVTRLMKAFSFGWSFQLKSIKE